MNNNPFLNGQTKDQVDGALGAAQEVGRLGQHDLAGDGCIPEGVQDGFGPLVVEIRGSGESHQGARIEDVTRISHAQSLPAGKGQLGPLRFHTIPEQNHPAAATSCQEAPWLAFVRPSAWSL